ncbi:MAG TPA: LamG domain-containing protein [Firmicutes bacterium]|nr:LamG domain-containing protein [Bacillota bacterium]
MTSLRKRTATIALSVAAVAMTAGGIATLSTVTADAEVTEIAPIAKYEFKDATNFGKDSMGNYNMSYRNAWQAGGTGPLLDKGTLIDGGGVQFAGEFCVAQDANNNIFEDVTAFTLAFEIKTETATVDWAHYIGVGNGNKDMAVIAVPGSADARFVALNTENDKLCTNEQGGVDKCWGAAPMPGIGSSEFAKVIISAQPGGQLKVYVNGTEVTSEEKLPADLPDDWSPYDQNCTFSIGANYNGAAAYTSTGSIKNVVFYDFAMDAACAAAYNTNGKVTPADVAGMKTITGLSVTDESFGENEPTKGALFAGMSAEDMLKQMNEATATVALSDSTTATAPVVWTSVTETDGTYYANGTVDTTKLGYANVYGNAVSYALEVAEIEGISEPQFAGEVTKGELLDSMTEEEMLALINTASVTVTLPDQSEETVTVTFSRIEAEMGVYTAYADVVMSGATVGTVKVVVEVTETNEGDMQELLPVAKYEFEDASNPGKDSMGNYNLGLVAKEGGDISNPWNTGTVEDGVLYLDGTDMLACTALNDVGDNLNNGFTLNFQYRQDGAQPGAWAVPVGFGFNDWNVTVVCSFRVEGGYTHLRVAGHGGVAEGDGNTFYGPVVVQDGTDKMHNVTLSVRPGEKFNVYADGVLAYSTDCPADWNVSNSNMAFSIGGECVWGNGYNPFKGWVDNVSIYNFALTLDQSNAYWEKGKLTVGDMNGEIITSISSTPVFEGGEVTNGNLTDRLTDTQAVRRVNPATVDALFENEDSVTLNVTWKRLEKAGDGKWYIVGVVDTSDLGYATILTGEQEVRQEVTVERAAREVIVDSQIKNGTVTADKEEAYLGDTVTFTVTPAEGYEIASVTVNGAALTAGADGKYTYTVEGIEDIEVSAAFRATSSGGGDSQGGTQEPGNNTGLWIGIGVGAAVIVAAAVVAVVLIKKKNANRK